MYQGGGIAASVREASVRRDSLNVRFVTAEVRFDGNRRSFDYLDAYVPYADRVRASTSLVRIDCEMTDRLFVQSMYLFDRDGNLLGQVEYPESGQENPAPPATMAADILHWICARAPAPVTTSGPSKIAAPRQQESDTPSNIPESDTGTAGSGFAVSTTDL